MTHDERTVIYSQMREYKAQGHTNKEVAKHFKCSKSTAQRVCNGICDLSHKTNQYTNGKFDRIENCKRIIEEHNPNLEYFGGFKDVDSPVDVRCKTCGHVFSRSMITLRHPKKNTVCPACEESRKQKEKEEKQKAAQELADRKKIIQYQNRVRKSKNVQYEMATCKCCGELFMLTRKGTDYCSDACRKRIANAIAKDKRIKRIRSVIVDRNITLEELFKRSKGKCALCGEPCDYDDYYYRGETFIAGNSYPSIDHIIPLSRGGLHSWDNVQLAHRLCNTEKSNTV